MAQCANAVRRCCAPAALRAWPIIAGDAMYGQRCIWGVVSAATSGGGKAYVVGSQPAANAISAICLAPGIVRCMRCGAGAGKWLMVSAMQMKCSADDSGRPAAAGSVTWRQRCKRAYPKRRWCLQQCRCLANLALLCGCRRRAAMVSIMQLRAGVSNGEANANANGSANGGNSSVLYAVRCATVRDEIWTGASDKDEQGAQTTPG